MATKKKATKVPAPQVAAPTAKPLLVLVPEDDARLARLPPACAEAIRKAARETTYTAILPHVTAAFEAVAFPKGKVYALPASLTPDQLELARFATDHLVLPSAGFAIPEYQWCREGWLRGGRVLDQPFDIEVDGARRSEPIWRALQIAAQSDEIGPRVIAKLALETLLEVFVELCVEQKGFLLEYVGKSWPDGRGFTEPAVKRIVSEVKEDLGPWAAKAADRVLSIEAEPHRSIPDAVRWPVFLALARAHPKMPIEPRWDQLVPLGIRELAEPMLECARAIPAERREAALVKVLGRMGGEVAEQGALVLMEAFSSPEITTWLHGFNTKNQAVRRRYVEGLVDALAKRNSVVAETWTKLQAGQPARLTLH